MDIEIPSETTADFLIRIGLYIGAFFQLTCIFAIIILPDKNSETTVQKKSHGDVSDQETWDSPPHNPPRNYQHKLRKQDKKKRR